MKQILLIDNYDSFTYNLHHCIEKNNDAKVTVVRNDHLLSVNTASFDKIILSPGPGLPAEAGQLLSFIAMHYQTKPMLGICLGHQALGQFFGAQLKQLPAVLHGVQLQTRISETKGLFKLLPSKIATGHYHSWVLEELDFPSCLKITSRNEEGGIMSFMHYDYDLMGIQFHPESVLTPMGDNIIKNWLNL